MDLLRSFHAHFFWVFLRSNCSDPIVGDMLGFRMTDNDSNEADGTPQPPQWCYPPQQETRGYSRAVTLSLSRKAVQGKVGFVMMIKCLESFQNYLGSTCTT